MKANELRIGNFIQDSSAPERTCIVSRLSGGNEFNITYRYNAAYEQSYNKGDEHKLEPIHLTEEWLRRFVGFSQKFITDPQEPYAESKYWIDNFELISTPQGMVFWYNDNPVGVEYVHQLQNLYFALAGEELKINP